MADGIKIEDLDEVTVEEIQDEDIVEITHDGNSRKAKRGTIYPPIPGIHRKTKENAAASIDFNDLDVFLHGTIVSVSGTNLEVINANGPDSGLNDSDLVIWHVITFGTETEITQLAFSSYQTIEKAFIRYGEIGSDAVWSEWILFSSSTENSMGLAIKIDLSDDETPSGVTNVFQPVVVNSSESVDFPSVGFTHLGNGEWENNTGKDLWVVSNLDFGSKRNASAGHKYAIKMGIWNGVSYDELNDLHYCQTDNQFRYPSMNFIYFLENGKSSRPLVADTDGTAAFTTIAFQHYIKGL